MSTTGADLEQLSDLCTPWCVHVAATLRIADYLASGKTEIREIASAAGAEPEALLRVMRQLVSKGVFEEAPEQRHFALNDAARGLLNEGTRLGLNLDSFGGRMANAWTTLLPAVRTGKAAYDRAFGCGFWEDLDRHPGLAADFDSLMGVAGHGLPDGNVLIDPADWDGVRTVVDVGGGTGTLLAQVLRAQTHVRGILVDLPRTVALAGAVFEAAGVADRATAVGQSFFDPLPAGADVYLLKSVLGDWPDPEAESILARCCEAARPHGRVVVLNGVTQEAQAFPDLLMLVLVGGKQRTLPEFANLAGAAGLDVRSAARQASGRFVVECVPR